MWPLFYPWLNLVNPELNKQYLIHNIETRLNANLTPVKNLSRAGDLFKVFVNKPFFFKRPPLKKLKKL